MHGGTINLKESPGVPDGEEVEVVVRPVESGRSWGNGSCPLAGGAADASGFEEAFAESVAVLRSAGMGADFPSLYPTRAPLEFEAGLAILKDCSNLVGIR